MDNLWAVDPKSWGIVLSLLIKMGVGVLLAALIGYERERHGRPAGIRTHMLVILGVILFSEVSKGFPNSEPSRIAAQIVTGIGFLGAGTILRMGPEVKGLTSAASIWAVASIGMAVSLGGPYMVVAMIATVMTLLTLAVVDRIERKLIPEAHPSELLLSLEKRSDVVGVLEAFTQEKVQVSTVAVLGTEPTIDLLLHVAGDQHDIMRIACMLPGVKHASWKN